MWTFWAKELFVVRVIVYIVGHCEAPVLYPLKATSQVVIMVIKAYLQAWLQYYMLTDAATPVAKATWETQVQFPSHSQNWMQRGVPVVPATWDTEAGAPQHVKTLSKKNKSPGIAPCLLGVKIVPG